MDEAKYVCEPHYDEYGNFDYWNPLFPYKRDTCEGCVIPNRDYGHAPSPCNFCARNHEDRYDLYTPAEVVE